MVEVSSTCQAARIELILRCPQVLLRLATRFRFVADFFGLTAFPIPTTMHGADGEFSIRALSDRERIAIEDYFSRKDVKLTLASNTTAVVVPHSHGANATTEEVATLIECALGILCASGFQPITVLATLTSATCSGASRRFYPESAAKPKFPSKIVRATASTWVRHFFAARRKTKDKLHITADRFVRYLRMEDSRDAFVDLCICLESLIESHTEISFRFAVCLAKVSGLDDLEKTSNLLADLYDLRSKVVHGADSQKEHNKVRPNAVRLRLAARAILTAYVLYLTEHSKTDWLRHLKRSLLE